jgi:hypothetical protein
MEVRVFDTAGAQAVRCMWHRNCLAGRLGCLLMLCAEAMETAQMSCSRVATWQPLRSDQRMRKLCFRRWRRRGPWSRTTPPWQPPTGHRSRRGTSSRVPGLAGEERVSPARECSGGRRITRVRVPDRRTAAKPPWPCCAEAQQRRASRTLRALARYMRVETYAGSSRLTRRRLLDPTHIALSRGRSAA